MMTPFLRASLFVVLVLVAGFVAVSLFDLVMSVMNPRKYSKLFFVVVFGIGGAFAGFQAYATGYKSLKEKSKRPHPYTFLLILATSGIFFFLLALLEGGEYGTAFRSYSVMSSLAGALCLHLKVDF